MDDRWLTEQARAGSQEAFAALVEQYQTRVYSMALRMTGSPEDAADLTQEAFLNAWRGLPSFQGDSSFSTWLYRLTNNLCIDFLRREKRRRGVDGGWSLDEEENDHAPLLRDPSLSPHARLEREERRAALQRGMAQLSEEHRQVLVLRELAGLSYAEIAETVGVEEGTVKSRIARARLALRKILCEDGNFFALSSSE